MTYLNFRPPFWRRVCYETRNLPLTTTTMKAQYERARKTSFVSHILGSSCILCKSFQGCKIKTLPLCWVASLNRLSKWQTETKWNIIQVKNKHFVVSSKSKLQGFHCMKWLEVVLPSPPDGMLVIAVLLPWSNFTIPIYP